MTHPGILTSAALAAALSLAALCPAHASGAQSAGALTFRVTVAGAARDGGVITAPIGAVPTMAGVDPDFNGCAVIKHRSDGASSYEIHMNYKGGLNLMVVGDKPSVTQEIHLTVRNYRPNAASYVAGDPNFVSLAFALNGRVYGLGLDNMAHLRNGERDGTIVSRHASRLYPASGSGSGSHKVTGVTYQASWHCATVLHLTQSI